MRKCAALCCAALAAPGALAYSWAQTGGSAQRAGMFPPSSFSSIVGISLSTSESPQSVRGSGSGAAAPLTAPAAPVPTMVTPKQFSFPTAYTELEKSAMPVVTSYGTVIFATPACDLAGLPNPDSQGSTWGPGGASWTTNNEDNPNVGSNCFDLLLDESDNLFHVTGQRAQLDNDTIVGYKTSANKAPTLLGGGSTFPVPTLTTLPVFEEYSVSALYADGKFWMPSSPTFSQIGVVAVDTTSGARTVYEMGADSFDHAASSVAIKSPMGDGSTAFLFTVAGSANALFVTNIMNAYDSNGGLMWKAPYTGQVSGVQPHPLYVPSTDPSKGRIYIALTQDAATAMFVCLNVLDGSACSGGSFPAKLPIVLDTFSTGWWYSGALVPSSDGTTAVRLLYTVDLASTSEPTLPIGCMVAMSPTSGFKLEHYCVPRDLNGRSFATNFLATAPVVFVNARGQGLHTAFVAQYDSIVLAFDPMNLAATGVLYALDPIGPGDSATVSSDYLAVTAGGSLILAGWRVGTTDSEYVVTAVINVAGSSPGSPTTSNGPAPPALSPGAAAGLSITLIVVVGAAFALFPAYRSGRLGAAIAKFSPSSVRYVAVPSSTTFKAPSGSYGSTGGGGGGSYGSASSGSAGSPRSFQNL